MKVTTIAQPPVERLKMALQTFSNDSVMSQSFIRTDKDIYAPGEKIWYEIDLYNVITQQPVSNKMIVLMLKNETGEVIVDQQERIENGSASGSLTVPSWADCGYMYLMTYDSESLKINWSLLPAIKPVYINRISKTLFNIEASTTKKIYDAGDDVTLWVKLNPLTSSSGKERISVSLYDDDVEVFSEKLMVVTGEPVMLKYKLPTDVKHGLYFHIRITGSGSNSCKIQIPTTSDRLFLQFYPEGNTLLPDQQQRIVYRAFSPFGQPVSVEGTIYDQTGHRSGLAKILKNHVGLVSLMPFAGNQYTLKIESEYGKDQKFELPLPVLNSTAIHLHKVSNKRVSIDILNTGSNVGGNYSAVVLSKGQVYLHFDFIAEAKNSFQINTDDIPGDIIHIIILAPNSDVLSERLIYCGETKDSKQFDIKTAPVVVNPNNGFDIEIDLNRLLIADSVVGVGLNVVDKHRLFNNKEEGYNRFLSNPLTSYPPKNVLSRHICNIELLGNSYAYFIEDILKGKTALSGETRQGISGIVIDKSGNPVVGARVLLRHRDENALKTVRSDTKGKFLFRGLNKSPNMTIKAVNEEGNKTYIVKLDRSFDQILSDVFLKHQFNCRLGYGADTYMYYQQNKHLFNDVGIVDAMNVNVKTHISAEKILKSDSSILEVIRAIKPFDIINNQIVFCDSRVSPNLQQGALIIIDGQKVGTGLHALSEVSLHDVTSINISTKPTDIKQYTGLKSLSLIEIYTSRLLRCKSSIAKNEDSEFSNDFRYDNFKPDVWKYQTTLLWQPEVGINDVGKVKYNVRTSAVCSDFIVQVIITLSNGTVITKEKIIEVTEE